MKKPKLKTKSRAKKQGAAWAYIGQFYIVLSIIRSIAMIIKG